MTLTLIFGCLIATEQSFAAAIEVRLFVETTQWIGQPIAKSEADKIMKALKGKPGIDIDFVTAKDSPTWMTKVTKDGKADIYVMFGDFIPEIYPQGNAKVDGSVAEEFLDNGNIFINTADYMFWGLGGRNKEGGLQNMMDVPAIVMWDNNSAMKVSADGKKLTPTLKDYATDRPFHMDQIKGTDWEPEVVFASNSGDATGNRADPVIVKNKKTNGRLGIAYQTADQIDPKGEVISEMILNYLMPKIALDVEAKGKLPMAWGRIKSSRY